MIEPPGPGSCLEHGPDTQDVQAQVSTVPASAATATEHARRQMVRRRIPGHSVPQPPRTSRPLVSLERASGRVAARRSTYEPWLKPPLLRPTRFYPALRNHRITIWRAIRAGLPLAPPRPSSSRPGNWPEALPPFPVFGHERGGERFLAQHRVHDLEETPGTRQRLGLSIGVGTNTKRSTWG